MPIATQAGSTVTGASVVDASLSTADLDAASIEELEPGCLTVHGRPNFVHGTATNASSSRTVGTNTTAHVAQVVIDKKITVNKFSFVVGAVGAAGTLKIALFSEDGQTQIFSFTTASISATGVHTHTLASPVSVPAGVYYIVVLPVSTASIDVRIYSNIDGTYAALNEGVTSEPILNGTLTVTASTMPATIDPTGITGGTGTSQCLQFRLDN